MTKTRILTASLLVTALGATGVHAADSYDHFTAGNPDSSREPIVWDVTARQPSVGSDFDRYHGIADGNGDLFGVELGSSPETDRPEIYGAFGDSPDLSY